MPRTPVLLLLLALGACGEGDARHGTGVDAAPSAGAGAGAGAGEAPAASAARRVEDPRLSDLREALDLGDLHQAEALLPVVAPLAGVPEEDLLVARLCLLRADTTGAEQALARARAAAPDDPRVPATAAEVHTWGGMTETAQRDLQDALRRWPEGTPELVRARGVQLICTEGGARAGLALLEEARRLDPGLPFCRRALGQAHLLTGKSHAATNATLGLEHARASLEQDPADLDARLFLADMLMATGEWGQGLEAYEGLLAEGRPLEAEVARHYKNAGVVALAQGLRELAVTYFLRARELGIAPDEFRTGENTLDEEVRLRLVQVEQRLAEGDREGADALLADCDRLVPGSERKARFLALQEIDAAVGLAAAGDAPGAEARLGRALELDPDSIEAHQFLAQLRFAREDWSGAAEHWYYVVDTARLEEVELPEPVHHRLSETLFRAGRDAEAREVLEAYLVLEPEGRWVQQTRRLLELLPEPPPAQGDGAGTGGTPPEGDPAERGPARVPDRSHDGGATGTDGNGAGGR